MCRNERIEVETIASSWVWMWIVYVNEMRRTIVEGGSWEWNFEYSWVYRTLEDEEGNDWVYECEWNYDAASKEPVTEYCYPPRGRGNYIRMCEKIIFSEHNERGSKLLSVSLNRLPIRWERSKWRHVERVANYEPIVEGLCEVQMIVKPLSECREGHSRKNMVEQ